ncbi:hypothetical protein D3C76_904830 [compost metagenome]
MVDLILGDGGKGGRKDHLIGFCHRAKIQVHGIHRYIDHQGGVLSAGLQVFRQLQPIITGIIGGCLGFTIIPLTVEIEIEIDGRALNVSINRLS